MRDQTMTHSTHTVLVTGGNEYSFDGNLLGYDSSYRDSHTHPPGRLPYKGQRCSGCRWTEIRIYWSESECCYVVSSIGRSNLSGEENRVKTIWTFNPEEVLDFLLVPPPKDSPFDRDLLDLPEPNENALIQASQKDPKLNKVYVEWLSETEDD
jgi:hypothetical protein